MVSLSIRLGVKSFVLTVHVVRGATQAILLGFDFMRQNRAIIDVGLGLLCIIGVDIPLLWDADVIPLCCNVSLFIDATVPPFSEMVFPVQVDLPRMGGPIVEPYLGYYLEPDPDPHDGSGGCVHGSISRG